MPNENEHPAPTQDTKQIRRKKSKIFLRTGLMIFFEIGLPIALYYILKNYMKEVTALIISGIPPFIVVVFGLIRRRRLDVLGVMIILSYIVSAIVASLRNDARLQLLRESAITGTIGLAFVITLIPIKIGSLQMRPLIFYFAKDMATGGSFGYSSSKDGFPVSIEDESIDERWDRHWNSYPMFRRAFITITAVWGFGLLSEVPIRVIIVFKSKTIDQAFLLTNVVTYTWLGLLILFNGIYSNWMRKKGHKVVAAALAANIYNTSDTDSTDAVATVDNQPSEQSVV